MKTSIFLVLCAVLAFIWAVRHDADQRKACADRVCAPGKIGRMLSSGRYAVECVCVEVPQ